MINEGSLSRFEPLGNGLLKPIYSDYSFGNIPNTVHYLLTGERLGPILPEDCFGGSYPKPDKVVLFFIDAFGWKFWQDHWRDFAPMRRVVENGMLTPISALFPSTTAASVTTMNLGVLPAQHAIYGWSIYVPAYGEVIQTLPFMPLGRHPRDACLEKGYAIEDMFACHETAHQRLGRHGVRSIQFAHRDYSASAYNSVASAGAEIIPHFTLAEAMVQLKEAITSLEGKAWLNFYWASLDSIAHAYGPGSKYHAAEIASFWQTFEAILCGLDSTNTLFLFTADHGQVYADRDETVYINERLPALAGCLPMSPTGNLIYPNGSPRDLFLHVRPERREDVLATLKTAFSDIAHIMTVDALLGMQLFGPDPIAPELRRRLGDIVILPYDGQFVMWREPGLMENRFYGHHGGLAPAELITVLGAASSL